MEGARGITTSKLSLTHLPISCLDPHWPMEAEVLGACLLIGPCGPWGPAPMRAGGAGSPHCHLSTSCHRFTSAQPWKGLTSAECAPRDGSPLPLSHVSSTLTSEFSGRLLMSGGRCTIHASLGWHATPLKLLCQAQAQIPAKRGSVQSKPQLSVSG